jgi:hypothetical protein
VALVRTGAQNVTCTILVFEIVVNECHSCAQDEQQRKRHRKSKHEEADASFPRIVYNAGLVSHLLHHLHTSHGSVKQAVFPNTDTRLQTLFNDTVTCSAELQ